MKDHNFKEIRLAAKFIDHSGNYWTAEIYDDSIVISEDDADHTYSYIQIDKDVAAELILFLQRHLEDE